MSAALGIFLLARGFLSYPVRNGNRCLKAIFPADYYLLILAWLEFSQEHVI